MLLSDNKYKKDGKKLKKWKIRGEKVKNYRVNDIKSEEMENQDKK